ncbi:SpoIID/LytB domain-containing protein [Paenibacillus sp. sgz302251]|uniref:SpoIID/LytB domain-containing protein n=1 Tax=Paenibacillus sp. sgz302251 TaxID=3414493 RepID=UPI003C7D675D
MATKRSIKRAVMLSITILLLASAWRGAPSHAAVPKLDQIRVALFMQLPGKYDSTTAAATFSSAGGIKVGTVQPGGISDWFSIAGAEQARFMVDDYKVKVYEGTNFATALAATKRLQALKGAAYLVSLSKNGAVTYQVLEGTYKSSAEAAAAQAKWSADSELMRLIGSFQSLLHGPLHLETGPLGSKAAAITAARAFGSAGLDAYVTVRSPQKGITNYSVMVGAAVSSAELDLIKLAAANVQGGAGLTAADQQAPYLMLRSEHTISGTASSSLELYSFAGGDAKITITPAGADPIKLMERSNRTYRGLFELSVLNGRLAVVNELSFEHYLYSVVGVEMYASWPAEALKAQAVAARSYVLNKGFGYQIAHVVDTTLSQAYYGTSSEAPSTIAAVDATAGEVALYNGKVIEALYYANAGGMTADAKEAWNNSIPYLQPVKSPDGALEAGLRKWYRVVLPSGTIGYIREDLLNETGKTTAAGSQVMQVNTNGTKVRKHPVIQDTLPPVGQVDSGAQVVVLEKTTESNSMSWVRGPYTAQEMLSAINARVKTPLTSAVRSLKVSQRGPSGRVIEVTANGQKLDISNPDSLRGTLGVQGSLQSTLFQIDETAKVELRGAGAAVRSKQTDSAPIYTISAGGKVTEASSANYFIVDGSGNIRAASKEPGFRFIGTGNGHGVGLSQYGALGLAQQGYDYQNILKYYYKDVTIAKE